MVMLASPKRITLDFPLAQARTTLFFPPLMSRLGLLQGSLRGFILFVFLVPFPNEIDQSHQTTNDANEIVNLAQT